jgi:hypothetical protein
MSRRKNVFKSADPPDSARMRSVSWEALQVTGADFEHPDGRVKEPHELTDAQKFCIREIRRTPNGKISGYLLLNRDTLLASYQKAVGDTGRGDVNIGIGIGRTQYIHGLAADLEETFKAFDARKDKELKPHDPGYDAETESLRLIADQVRDDQLIRAGGNLKDVTPARRGEQKLKVIEHVPISKPDKDER